MSHHKQNNEKVLVAMSGGVDRRLMIGAECAKPVSGGIKMIQEEADGGFSYDSCNKCRRSN